MASLLVPSSETVTSAKDPGLAPAVLRIAGAVESLIRV